ncbi:uncharacterized protein MYCFIDRAFT_172134 [Pseudocercospora fijiensis CIRAD86]|uniref:Uncharacterized protein n=1 Tax=Pseudocercospora fijiensis (strain CIRAD86) TaxID=383855 RepID=M2Z988_PSEFD|nr:uncharacterized protein MYCFIDRAFT_172134 [Pseudocercospora fijiensis CIRAD86]EME86365.1 hypothetical protein MYCFIDRAFT_172134 [Pseudocercospora fijiensis CIRAD86]
MRPLPPAEKPSSVHGNGKCCISTRQGSNASAPGTGIATVTGQRAGCSNASVQSARHWTSSGDAAPSITNLDCSHLIPYAFQLVSFTMTFITYYDASLGEPTQHLSSKTSYYCWINDGRTRPCRIYSAASSFAPDLEVLALSVPMEAAFLDANHVWWGNMPGHCIGHRPRATRGRHSWYQRWSVHGLHYIHHLRSTLIIPTPMLLAHAKPRHKRRTELHKSNVAAISLPNALLTRPGHRPLESEYLQARDWRKRRSPNDIRMANIFGGALSADSDYTTPKRDSARLESRSDNCDTNWPNAACDADCYEAEPRLGQQDHDEARLRRAGAGGESGHLAPIASAPTKRLSRLLPAETPKRLIMFLDDILIHMLWNMSIQCRSVAEAEVWFHFLTTSRKLYMTYRGFLGVFALGRRHGPDETSMHRIADQS